MEELTFCEVSNSEVEDSSSESLSDVIIIEDSMQISENEEIFDSVSSSESESNKEIFQDEGNPFPWNSVHQQILVINPLNFEDILPNEEIEDYSNNSLGETFYFENTPIKTETKKVLELPEAIFTEVETDEPIFPFTKPASFIRWIDKTIDEEDLTVEYDMDSEDEEWLQDYNSIKAVSEEKLGENIFEMIIDRFEKEAFRLGWNERSVLDGIDDSFCCICGDGDSDDGNVIVFCDGCHVAVHQDCYGIPLIPDGRWLCLKCEVLENIKNKKSEETKDSLRCVLCPRKGGAMKRTSCNRWAHSACALWIPETSHKLTIGPDGEEFLGDIDGISSIPDGRYKLVCTLCKQKMVGACIQCNAPMCPVAFHVGCAKKCNIKMEHYWMADQETYGYFAYCQRHRKTPNFEKLDASTLKKQYKYYEALNAKNGKNSKNGSTTPRKKIETTTRSQRKLLSKEKNEKKEQKKKQKIDKEVTLLNIEKSVTLNSQSQNGIKKVFDFWQQKRDKRGGMPLIKRFQPEIRHTESEKKHKNFDQEELYGQMRWIRKDLERVRILLELVKKREKSSKDMVETLLGKK